VRQLSKSYAGGGPPANLDKTFNPFESIEEPLSAILEQQKLMNDKERRSSAKELKHQK